MNVVRRKPARSIVLTLIIVLLVILAAQAAWNYQMAPRLAIRKVILDSDLGISDSQLMEMLDIAGETWASLDEEELSLRLESYPVVRKAGVVKVFPDTLKLYIYRRRPLVVVFVDSEYSTLPAVFDEEGYAVQIGSGTGGMDMPVISGPRFPEPSLGSRLPDEFSELLADLSALRSDDPKLFELISEIEIMARGDAGFDLKLYMNYVPIPILVDRDINAESIRRAVLVLDVLATDSVGRVDEADMRGGHVVFRRMEEI